jgi:hypothetical protein
MSVWYYKPQGVLSLVQLCAKAIKENEDLLKNEILSIPLALQNYVKEVKQGFIYVSKVEKPRERMDIYENRKYEKIKGKRVVQCSLCSKYCYCNIFLKTFDALECYIFPDRLPSNYRCFCCNRIATNEVK